MAKKFTRYTKGVNSQAFISKAIAITTQATYDLFVANAALGEIGVYDAVNARHTDAITATEKYFICQKLTGGVRKTPLYAFSEIRKNKKVYVAPVKAEGSFGWNGTTGALNLAAAPAAGKGYEFAIIETTEGNDPYPTWNYNYVAKAGDTEPDVVQALAKLVNDPTNIIYRSNTRLVTATVKADATYGNYALTGTTPILIVTNGSEFVQIESGANDGVADIAVGDFISFNAAAAPTDDVGDIYKVIAKAAGNDALLTLNRKYQGATQTFTEAEAEGTRVKKVTAILQSGLEFTAINNYEHFRIAVRDELQYATIQNLTAFTNGNGTYDQVLELEAEATTFAGDTAKNTQFAADYGVPDKFALSTETYDMYNLDSYTDLSKSDKSMEGKHQAIIQIAAAKSAGGLSASLNTLFGL